MRITPYSRRYLVSHCVLSFGGEERPAVVCEWATSFAGWMAYTNGTGTVTTLSTVPI